MTNKLKKVYFRVETGYVWGQGHSKENSATLKDEVRKIFLPLGFEIVAPTISGASEEAVKGYENLYLHPQDFSGLVKEESISVIEEAIKNSNIKLSMVDVYETYYEGDENFLLEKLQCQKEEKKQMLLSTFKTTRKNKFVSLNIYDLRSPIKLVNENLANKVYRNFINSIIDEMYNEGLLIKMNDDPESRYFRSLNSTELKKWQSVNKKKVA